MTKKFLPHVPSHSPRLRVLSMSLLALTIMPLTQAQADKAIDYSHRKPTPASISVSTPTILDSDKDGVSNAHDRCLRTQLLVEVDKFGCVADDDQDGVPNAQDRCPGTPLGTEVDINGCPLPIAPPPVAPVVIAPVPEPTPAPAPAPIPAPEPAEELITETQNITLNVEFDNNSAVLRPISYPEIEKLAAFLIEHPELNDVVIEGHTDDRGSDQMNQGLSQRRAQSVVTALTTRYGIDKLRLRAMGYGESRPIATNDSEAGRQINRRVVAVASVKKEKKVRKNSKKL